MGVLAVGVGGALAEEPRGAEPQALARHVKSLIETQYTYHTILPLRVYRSLVWGALLIFKNYAKLYIM